MSDLIERLRRPIKGYPHGCTASKTWHDAADELEAKDKRIEELEALRDTSIAGARIKFLEQENTKQRDYFEAKNERLRDVLREHLNRDSFSTKRAARKELTAQEKENE